MAEQLPLCDYIKGLYPGLWPKRPFVGVTPERDRGIPPPFLGEAIYVGRGFQGRIITIGTSPVLVQKSEFAWPYMVLNPSRTVGLTTSGLVASGTVTANGNSQASSIGVANYLNMHFHLDITAITGTWDIYAQTRDPQTGKWADSQVLFGTLTAAGTYYGSIGQLGNVVDFAVRWVEVVAGSMTFSLSYSLKDGTLGSGAGLAQTIYLGSNDGVSIVSGFPLLEGERLTFVLGEGIELWGVAEATVNARVFQL